MKFKLKNDYHSVKAETEVKQPKNDLKSMQIECTFHFYGLNIQLRITLVKVENFEIDKVLVSCRGSMQAKEHIKASTLRVYIRVYHTRKQVLESTRLLGNISLNCIES